MVGRAIKRELENTFYSSGKILSPNRRELDLINSYQVEKWFLENKPSVVIIAAAKVGGILSNSNYPADFILENLKIQTNLIDSAWKFGVKRLLFLGSSCIYPKFCDQPISEESLLNGILEPTNEPYAIAKIAGIKLCHALRKQYNFDAISLMPTNLYGPGDNYDDDNSHVMASLIKKFYEAKKYSLNKVICWGSGSPMREFMHVDDLAKAVIFTLENWDPDSKNSPKHKNGKALTFLNVGTGLDISIKDLAIKIANITGFDGEICWDKSKPDGTPRKLLNIERIKSLGWVPKITLDEGIKKTIHEYKYLSEI